MASVNKAVVYVVPRVVKKRCTLLLQTGPALFWSHWFVKGKRQDKRDEL